MKYNVQLENLSLKVTVSTRLESYARAQRPSDVII